MESTRDKLFTAWKNTWTRKHLDVACVFRDFNGARGCSPGRQVVWKRLSTKSKLDLHEQLSFCKLCCQYPSDLGTERGTTIDSESVLDRL